MTQRLAILGVGLIGGSIGLAARERGLAEVTGYVRNPDRAEECLRLGAVDRIADSIEEAAAHADIVICCASVGSLAEMAKRALGAAGPDCVVTDVGSTKQELVEAMGGDERFIGGHPLAGAETAGVANARADLYEGARWYLTPTGNASGVLYDRLQRLVKGMGARPMAIEAAEHDQAMAAVSHLPHVFANQLAVQGRPGTERLGGLAPSLRDATRVAGSNPDIWGEIFATNHVAVAAAIRESITGLERAAEVIESADPQRIAAWQAAAASERACLSAAETEGEATHQLRVLVPNRPGILAELALALGRAGVNITDMSLDPAPDMSSGAISLWVAGEGEAEKAEACIAGLGHSVSPVGEA
ncbi:MAG TPA: prephenate dehydrogenase/arogenate dehydrogenase family protein [Solirubrobacterales bacterium]|nr:prephenate dehydrogenase/arogenate dehydrogenase family protein [Solirubrobacterales bacterium]